MENPRTWGPVEKTIHEAFNEWETNGTIFGPSMEKTIANALRAAGLVKENDDSTTE